MSTIVWDQVGSRTFETGVDHGVLYLADRSGIPWNGLKSVVETTSSRVLTPLYFDGVKYSDSQVTGEFNGVLTAITYPDEFLEYEGTPEHIEGFYLKNQDLRRFHLSYRSKIGDDLNVDRGYKIHILYNLLAVPRDLTYQSINNATTPMDFAWTITSVPEVVEGYRPTGHVIIDTSKMNEDVLVDLFAILYGSDVLEPTLPTLQELKTWLDEYNGITITDNGDGTWTAEGTEQFITMLSETQFQIDEANATYLDADTYEISTGTDQE